MVHAEITRSHIRIESIGRKAGQSGGMIMKGIPDYTNVYVAYVLSKSKLLEG